MSPRALTFAAGNAARVARYALSRGVELAADAAPKPADALARVTTQQMFALWANMARALNSPALPFDLAHRSQLEHLDVLGLALVTAPTFLDTLRTFVRCGALLNESGSWELSVQSASVQLAWLGVDAPTLGVRLSRETSFAQTVQGARQLCGADVDPVRVSFRHRAPASIAAHREFFRCPVEFEASSDRIIFSRELSQAVPPAANPFVWAHLCAQADAQLAHLGPRSLRQRVSEELARGLLRGAALEMTDIAPALGCSERTLRRALAAEGTSFRALLDELRRERAEVLLERGNLSVSQAAFEAGFSDASAFTHACQRWFGSAPRSLARRSSSRAAAGGSQR